MANKGDYKLTRCRPTLIGWYAMFTVEWESFIAFSLERLTCFQTQSHVLITASYLSLLLLRTSSSTTSGASHFLYCTIAHESKSRLTRTLPCTYITKWRLVRSLKLFAQSK